MANNTTRRAKRAAELFQNVLGVTGAAGYGNAFRVGKRLSKRSSKNYLTTLRRKLNKSIVNRKKRIARMLPGYNPARHGTPLRYAIQLANPEAMRLLLDETKNVNQKDLADETLLDALVKNYFELVISTYRRGMDLAEKARRHTRAHNLIVFLPRLLARNPTFNYDTVKKVWMEASDRAFLHRFLVYRPFAEFSIEHREEIENDLWEEIQELQDMVDDDEPDRGVLSRMGSIRSRIFDLTHLAETYNPATGDYNLNPIPQVFNPIPPAGPAGPAAAGAGAGADDDDAAAAGQFGPAANIIAQLQAMGMWNENV